MQAPLTALLEDKQQNSQQQTPGMRGSQMFDEYQGQGDAALGIVGQVQELAATFSEDKQSSIDQENENAEATAKNTLQDEQAFLSRIEQQERDTTMLFDMRKKDRTEEKSAVTKAISVLSQEAPSLLQMGTRTRRAAIRLHAGCPHCGRAAK